MAEQPKGETSSEPAPEKTAAPRSKSVMLIRITVLLFVVAVIGAECLVASLCMPAVSESNAGQAGPSADDSSVTGAQQHGAGEHKSKSNHKKKSEDTKATGHGKHGAQKGESASPGEHSGDPPDQVEIDLEQFSVTAHQPDSNTTMRIEFHLFGVVSGADQEEFEKLLKANQHRFREQVLVTVRSAEGTDLADAGLGLIKRQILEKTNALFGKPLLKAVIVSQFSYMEQ